jgi:uncharacterized protein YkwD
MQGVIDGRRILAAALALLLSTLLLIGSAHPADAEDGRFGRRRQMLALTNQDREARDRRELGFAATLSRYAKSHSAAMARKGHLFHSTEGQLRNALAGYGWSIGGENVGVGGSLETLEAAFMASKLHRQNILRAEFERAAVGVIRDGDRYWVTVIFYG